MAVNQTSTGIESVLHEDRVFRPAEEFAKAYKLKFGYDPDYHAASAVADVEAFAKAIAAAGSLEPKKVRDALAKVDFESLYGRISFNEKGQISLPQTVMQIQNGHLVAVYGSKGFLEKPLYPMPPWSAR